MIMIVDSINIRFDFFEKLYFWILLLFAAKATVISYSFGVLSGGGVNFVLMFVLTCIIIKRNNISLRSKRVSILIFVLTIWFLFLHIANIAPFAPSLYIDIIFLVIITYVTVQCYKERIFELYEVTVTYLCVIALIMYVIMVSIGAINLASLGFVEPADRICIGSFLLYNVTSPSRYLEEGTTLFGLVRNSGFAWEPGRFASFIVIAIVINLLRTGNRFRRNRNLYILLAALFTTFSTTGYITIIIIFMVSYLVNGTRNVKYFVITGLVVIIGLLLFFQLPFLSEKIQSVSREDNYALENEGTFKYIETLDQNIMYTPQRFECISLDFLNFLKSPILGYGLDSKYSYVRTSISSQIALSNGVMKDFAMFGLILGGLYNLLLIKGARKLSDIYRSRNMFIFYIAYVLISFSYSFIALPCLSSLFLYDYFIKDKKRK